MEEITWIIYKVLIMDLNKNGINEIKQLWGKISWHRVLVSVSLVLLFLIIGLVIQNFYKIDLEIDVDQVFGVITRSLVTLVSFFGVMVIFGFQRTDSAKRNIEDRGEISTDTKEKYKSLTCGERLARDSMLKFGVYTFFVVIVNIFLLIFSNLISSKIILAFLFIDVALTGYSFLLVIRIISKILDSFYLDRKWLG